MADPIRGEIIVDAHEVERALKAAPDILRKEIKMAIRDTIATFKKEYIAKKLQYNRGGAVQHRNPTGSGVSGQLQWRTGSLARSFGQKVVDHEDVGKIHGYVGFGGTAAKWRGAAKKYVDIHQYGGTIRPKKRKFLTIPSEENLTGAGDLRWPSVPSMGKQAVIIINDDWTGGVVTEGEGGPVMWYLARKVTIKPRLDFFGEWKRFTPRAHARMNLGITRTTERMERAGKRG